MEGIFDIVGGGGVPFIFTYRYHVSLDCEQSLLLENPRGKSSRARVTRKRRSREKRARRETSEKRDCNGFIQ